MKHISVHGSFRKKGSDRTFMKTDDFKKDVSLAVRGDREAFSRLYALVYEDLYRTAFYSLRNEHDAADAVSETVLDAFSSIKKLRSEVKKVNTIYNLTSNIVEMIFSIFLRNAKNDFSEEENLESKIIYYLQKNNRFTNKVSLDDIAKYVGYSKYYTSTTFHKKFSITIQDFLINLRIEYAKKLLLESNFTIAEIVNQCGFISISNFYSNFIKLTGCTPLKFKKQNK